MATTEYEGLTVVEDGDITIYNIRAIDRVTVDALAEWILQKNIEASDNGNQHVLRVWSIDAVIYPTPYLSTTITRLLQQTPQDIQTSTAIVAGSAVPLRVMTAFLRRVLSSRRLTTYHFVRSMDEAREWLETQRDRTNR